MSVTTMNTTIRPVHRPGLTLVEMLVVLTILAITTIIAVQATDYLVDQARFDATQQTLQNIQTAIVGPPNGNPATTGFVADMGRLPQPVYVNGTISGDPLRELWDPTAIFTNSGKAFSLQTSGIPTTGQASPAILNSLGNPVQVTIQCGWRGPYLQLPAGSVNSVTGLPTLLDGWGNQFLSLYQAPGSTVWPTTPLASQPVNVVNSLGADNTLDVALPTTPYNLDQYVPVQLATPPVAPLASFSDRLSGNVVVTVQSINAIGPSLTNPYATSEAQPMVRVAVFVPVNGTLTTFFLDTGTGNFSYVASPPLQTASVDLTNPGKSPSDFSLATGGSTITTPVSGTFLNVPVGIRAIQAFQYDNNNKLIVTKRSPLTYVTVTPSGLSTTLILQ